MKMNEINEIRRKGPLAAFFKLDRWLFLLCLIALLTIFHALCVFSIIQFSTIRGHSMFPTLHDNDVVVATGIFEPERGDVIFFGKEELTYVKRIVGVPHDHVKLIAGVVVINGKMLQEEYLLMPHTDGKTNITLGADEYYVLGDSRFNSHDSRTFGPIKKEQITGQVILSWRSWIVK